MTSEQGNVVEYALQSSFPLLLDRFMGYPRTLARLVPSSVCSPAPSRSAAASSGMTEHEVRDDRKVSGVRGWGASMDDVHIIFGISDPHPRYVRKGIFCLSAD